LLGDNGIFHSILKFVVLSIFALDFQNTHPKLYQFCMEKLGLNEVLDYIHDNCPDRKVAARFRYGDYRNEIQMEMF
jgi:hypothetical protein